MVGDRRILKLIDEIYDASLDSRRWSGVIETLCPLFGCVGGALLQRSRESAEMDFIEFGGLDAATRSAYQQHYAARSVWMPSAFRGSGELVIGHELAPDKRRFERSEFYNDWLRPQNVYDAIGGVIRRTPASLTVLTVLREARAGLVADGDERLFLRLMPHVRRAIDIHRRLYGVQLQRDGALRALEALRIGILLADRRARVIFANGAAEAILRRCDGLMLVRDQLRATRSDDTERLARMIRGAAGTTLGNGEDAGGIILLATRTGAPLSVLVTPCPRVGLLEPAVLVFIAEPRPAPIESRHIATFYGLTPAEARLLRALADGERVADYAERAGITRNTAKTHLKQIFAKTGTKRQTELVRLLVSNPMLRLARSGI
jgi:DNA-binding CsgD family transcriptional regulator/PAS domain-containing protein